MTPTSYSIAMDKVTIKDSRNLVFEFTNKIIVMTRMTEWLLR